MTLGTQAQTVTVRVPGKINLGLSVGPLRDDGYHELSTVYHAVSLYDTVSVQPADSWSVHVTGPWGEHVPTDDSNLALVAARTLAKRRARKAKVDPVRIDIDKHIPVAGGMAGGSADAAATLVGCRELWGLDHLENDLLELMGASLGSDIPFLLHGGTAMGSGRGEQVTSVLARGELHWVLWAGEGLSLSTPQVYAECDRLREEAGVTPGPPEPSGELMTALRRMDTDEVAAALHNDLQEAAISLEPVLAEALSAGLDLGARAGIVSGSGPTVAFLVGSQTEAIDLSVGLAANGPTGDIERAVGPVPGAQIIHQRSSPEPPRARPDTDRSGPLGPVIG
ncbi:4-(cytidine 5'-diphospho)-2-C-methyl-D-erythritol kinase [Serinicoccus sp. CNJ-927]|uniref:4-(cytidine 5'-diphospho)-2-C-methyl-D-erythritol kinase n=1 Tax=unclassified Serinicoccus TaxID=2643101 RepID=UPI00095E1761|nr:MULTISPECIES: 4-(cytidine 5'-diphospho)-2-C-methyl-D-erythritol kinase [unclassified Serinicoccus]OLT18798.1 4-(cytidine 5'-diphospho)-2-C-methyl-D-erythritol kinase [Serinicoccus sp. CUA-874]OLT43380.1 4-(cytidine 5'-diphospho)-2-C-methyl-D-erythritol kinase [Serinicoccus sp. CNJ-927]